MNSSNKAAQEFKLAADPEFGRRLLIPRTVYIFICKPQCSLLLLGEPVGKSANICCTILPQQMSRIEIDWVSPSS